jgi:hypothetical protein
VTVTDKLHISVAELNFSLVWSEELLSLWVSTRWYMTWIHLSQNLHYSSRITIQTGDKLMSYNMHYYCYYYYFVIYSRPSVIRWRSPSKSSCQQIKAISPSTLPVLCAVLISVTFCSSMADRWPGSNCRLNYSSYGEIYLCCCSSKPWMCLLLHHHCTDSTTTPPYTNRSVVRFCLAVCCVGSDSDELHHSAKLRCSLGLGSIRFLACAS